MKVLQMEKQPSCWAETGAPAKQKILIGFGLRHCSDGKGKTEATVLGGWTWNINTNCKDPELAYDLIQYLNSEKGDSLLGVEGKISARKDFDYDKALEGNDKLKVFTEEFPYTEARPAVINEKSIDELITNAILEVDYGQSSAEDALTSLTQKLNENIASNYQ